MYARAGEPKKLVVLKSFGHYEVYGGHAGSPEALGQLNAFPARPQNPRQREGGRRVSERQRASATLLVIDLYRIAGVRHHELDRVQAMPASDQHLSDYHLVFSSCIVLAHYHLGFADE